MFDIFISRLSVYYKYILLHVGIIYYFHCVTCSDIDYDNITCCFLLCSDSSRVATKINQRKRKCEPNLPVSHTPINMFFVVVDVIRNEATGEKRKREIFFEGNCYITSAGFFFFFSFVIYFLVCG